MSKIRISIVGAGPAGLYAAELLAKEGFEISLFDHKVPWEKPCGGLIPPDTLREFPFLLSFPHLKSKCSKLVCESPTRRRKFWYFDKTSYIISRKELASFQLKRAVDAGTKLIAEIVETIMSYENRVDLKLPIADFFQNTFLGFVFNNRLFTNERENQV
ncbi:MAG: NAD(P)-binding protein [Proteobacteria bacterium]|nr:NAD(P)-binding protein [Pseudomonadota bacterium]